MRTALTTAGVPLGDDALGQLPGAVVRPTPYGVCVSWRTVDGPPPNRDTAGRAVGSTTVMSHEFQATLHLAAVLAHAGRRTDHLGNRVLITPADPAPAAEGP
ncbi:hypothetical protein GCM10009665_77310 [Kitasatospora nipponensis]|uniref:Uncharacterized protein n=1 Tax=Kitasatospora nipponensis TaxID=258049 RepID=A0ABN1T8Y6_9ACTN